MYTFIVIGAPGSGKSPWVKSMIEGRRCLVLDLQNEYGQRTKYPGQKALGLSNNTADPRSRFCPDYTKISVKEDVLKFIQIAANKRDTNVVFEECTIYLEGRQQEGIKKLIVGRLHTGNAYYFIFHSIASVPPRIMQICTHVVLHHTIDNEAVVLTKYPQLYKHFVDLQGKPLGTRIIIKLI